jgi:hypothetical protein
MGCLFDNSYIRWVQRPSIAACSLDCARHAGYQPAEVFTSSILTGQLLLVYSLKAGRFGYSKGGMAGKRELALRCSELLVDEEGGSSSSVPGFIYSVYHVTLIHPIEPSIYFSFIRDSPMGCFLITLIFGGYRDLV